MAAVKGEFRGLEVAVFLVWVTGRHVEGLVDFEPPGATLNRLEGGHFSEESGLN